MMGTIEITNECLNECSGRGECNHLTAICICDPGFGGVDCSFVENSDADEDATILEVSVCKLMFPAFGS
jgi:hypothetical protein